MKLDDGTSFDLGDLFRRVKAVEKLLKTKADASDIVTSSALESALALKADSASVDAKFEGLDSKFATAVAVDAKADTASVNAKFDGLDAKFATVADVDVLNATTAAQVSQGA